MVGIPGVRDCARYKLEWSDNADMLAYLALYHVDDSALPRSDAWKKHAAMGQWSTEIRPHVAARQNGVYRKLFHIGSAAPDSTDSDYIYFLQQSIPANLDAKFNAARHRIRLAGGEAVHPERHRWRQYTGAG